MAGPVFFALIRNAGARFAYIPQDKVYFMAHVIEIAPDLYRISWFWKDINLQFSHFLLVDDEPLLFTTGFRSTFDEIREAVKTVVDPAKLRWISYSHFESDECGALNQWLHVAPHAQPVASVTSALVNLTDFSDRQARPLADGETLVTGKHRLTLHCTPHLPHGWDACVLHDETTRTLLCSDLFHHNGECEPLVERDILGQVGEALRAMNASPMPNYMPWATHTAALFEKLAGLDPQTFAIMHGSSYRGNGAQAIRDLAVLMREVLGGEEAATAAA
jgi:flavorubredoxin